MKSYKLLIKTDSYAGNFERELCAHLTGHLGGCLVGEEYVDPEVEIEFEDSINQVADDHGNFRPVALGENSNDVVIFFVKEPTKKQIDIIKERIKTFSVKSLFAGHSPEQPKILGIDLIVSETIDSIMPII